jgi:hypothetical protein
MSRWNIGWDSRCRLAEPDRARLTGRAVAIAATIWLAIVGAGLLKLSAYAYTPGPPARAGATWPSAAPFARDRARPTIVVFVHPYCSCSTATVGELAKLMAHEQGRVAVHVLVYQPRAERAAWSHTDLWRSAAAIPGVTVSSDVDGMTAQAFGALVSGQALLYGADGTLVFSGGITIARGHAGDSAGRIGIQSWLASSSVTKAPALAVTPVFGCNIREEQP